MVPTVAMLSRPDREDECVCSGSENRYTPISILTASVVASK
jgi:hypothetical protein